MVTENNTDASKEVSIEKVIDKVNEAVFLMGDCLELLKDPSLTYYVKISPRIKNGAKILKSIAKSLSVRRDGFAKNEEKLAKRVERAAAKKAKEVAALAKAKDRVEKLSAKAEEAPAETPAAEEKPAEE